MRRSMPKSVFMAPRIFLTRMAVSLGERAALRVRTKVSPSFALVVHRPSGLHPDAVLDVLPLGLVPLSRLSPINLEVAARGPDEVLVAALAHLLERLLGRHAPDPTSPAESPQTAAAACRAPPKPLSIVWQGVPKHVSIVWKTSRSFPAGLHTVVFNDITPISALFPLSGSAPTPTSSSPVHLGCPRLSLIPIIGNIRSFLWSAPFATRFPSRPLILVATK